MAKDNIKPRAKDSKNYFDEEYVQGMIKIYQDLAVTLPNEKGKPVIQNSDFKFKKLEEDITIEVQKLVKAIIYIYGYQRFEPFDDLMQAGMLACFPNFLKFNEKNGTCFNFFSLISKRSLLNYTTRKKKHREVQDIEDKVNIRSPNYRDDIDFSVDDLERVLSNLVDENFLGKKRNKFQIIVSIICDYLRKNRKYIGKSDLYKFAGGYGMRSLDMREFINEVKHMYPDICMLLETDDEGSYSMTDLEEDTGQV